MWNEAETLIAEGQFDMGQRTGVWTKSHSRQECPSLREYPFTTFQEPFVSQATLRQGQLDGDWIIFDAKQRKCSQITFRDGQRHGPAVMWLADGEVYREAVYESDVPVGDVLQRDKNKTMSKAASYIDGRRLITKVNYFQGTRNKKTEAVYLDARSVMTEPDDFWTARFADYENVDEQLRHGPWKTWYSNGQVQLEGAYHNDKETGTFTWWHPNGQKAVAGEYADGLQQGSWVWWHANGQKATIGDYRQGQQVGLWRQWDSDGRLHRQTAFNDGQPEGQVVEIPASGDEPVEVGQKFPVLPWMSR
jgi:antitoxin component YwqK of YwqJK toxin-antitoxin module